MGLNLNNKRIEELLCEDSPLLKAAQQPPIKLYKFRGFTIKRSTSPTKPLIIRAPIVNKDN
jgi:hypothetical protein